LIFNEYAKRSGTDHLLQATRAQLFIDLMVEPDQASTHVAERERDLFAHLDKVANIDQRLQKNDVHLLPSVLPYLLSGDHRSPRHLLEAALELREKPEWKSYRTWYQRLRAAWARGMYDERAEHDLIEVSKEIEVRYKSSKYRADAPRVLSREIGLKATVGPELGPIKAGVEADLGKFPVSIPNSLRDWLIETIHFRNHRKVLLRMGLAQHQYTHLGLGLQRLWEQDTTVSG